MILLFLVFGLHCSQNTAPHRRWEARYPTRRDEPTLAVSDVIQSHSSRHSFIHDLIVGYMAITPIGSGKGENLFYDRNVVCVCDEWRDSLLYLSYRFWIEAKRDNDDDKIKQVRIIDIKSS